MAHRKSVTEERQDEAGTEAGEVIGGREVRGWIPSGEKGPLYEPRVSALHYPIRTAGMMRRPAPRRKGKPFMKFRVAG